MTISEKLSKDAEEKVERQLRLIDNLSREEQSKYTFMPQTSVSSELAAGTVNFIGSHEDFLERQRLMAERVKKKREELQAKLAERNYTFKPQINKTSEFIANTMDERHSEDFEQQVRRLSDMAVEKRMDKYQKLEKEHYAQYTFEPSINPQSKKLSRASSLNELANNENARQKRLMKLEEQNSLIENACSFKPTIIQNRKFSNVPSYYRNPDDIMKTIDEKNKIKEKKLEEIKRQSEQEELRACTFRPEANLARIDHDKQVQIRGLERFLELKELAKKQEEERKEREEKVFRLNPKQDPEQHYTVPQPFNLHPVTLTQSTKEIKIAKIKQEISERERQDLTFQPRITEK